MPTPHKHAALIKHGHSGRTARSPSYNSWRSMHARCRNDCQPRYKNYGGRGIAVCAEWATFEQFLADMGERPAGTSLDRIDADKGYSPENCRWATREQQDNNRTNTIKVTVNGTSMSVAQACREIGYDRETYRYHIKRGKTPQQVFDTVVSKRAEQHSRALLAANKQAIEGAR